MTNRTMLLTFAACLSMAFAATSYANCGTCGGGCPDSGCLSQGHEGCSDGSGGACLNCENIWDGYCESKKKCLPKAFVPLSQLQGLHAAGCGGCAPGVGIYGAQSCCGPSMSHKLVSFFNEKRLLLQNRGHFGCDSAIACDCDMGVSSSSSMMRGGSTSQPTFTYSRPATPKAPARRMNAIPRAPAMPSSETSPPEPVQELDSVPLDPPVPPAPEPGDAGEPAAEGTKEVSQAFGWLKQSLHLD